MDIVADEGGVARYSLSTKQNLGKRAFEIKDQGTGRLVWTTVRVALHHDLGSEEVTEIQRRPETWSRTR